MRLPFSCSTPTGLDRDLHPGKRALLRRGHLSLHVVILRVVRFLSNGRVCTVITRSLAATLLKPVFEELPLLLPDLDLGLGFLELVERVF